jgi:hypothetical protein
MKSPLDTVRPAPTPEAPAKPARRGLVVGAGVAGAAALAAHALHRGLAQPAPVAVAGATGAPAAEGYRLTEHVRRYYETTKA